jgi:hypothetical protein
LKLFAAIEHLRYLDGEKHLIVLAGGGLARHADDARVVARRANGARVAVHMVGTGGRLHEPSRDVVDWTGGRYSSLDMATTTLAEIDRSTRATYLLGYAPLDAALDGRYREIDVRVDRPGVELRFRRGYYAEDQPDPDEIRAAFMQSRLDAARTIAADAGELPVRATAEVLPRMGLQQLVRIEVTVDASRLGFEETDGRSFGRLELLAIGLDSREGIVGEAEDGMSLELDAAALDAAKQTGVRRIVRLRVTGTPRFVKVIVYDTVSDRLGSATVTLPR